MVLTHDYLITPGRDPAWQLPLAVCGTAGRQRELRCAIAAFKNLIRFNKFNAGLTFCFFLKKNGNEGINVI